MVIGASGAGKSTLARQIGAALGLPVIHMDPFFFQSGWVQRPAAETDGLAIAAAQGKAWVFEGNNSRTFDARAERADLIIVLRVARILRLWRNIGRTLRHYGQTRPDMAPGCPERFDWGFLLDFVWRWDSHGLASQEAFLARWQGQKPIVHLHSAREIRHFGRHASDMLACLTMDGES